MPRNRISPAIVLLLALLGTAACCRHGFLLDEPHVPNQLVVGWKRSVLNLPPPLDPKGWAIDRHASPTAFDQQVEGLIGSLGLVGLGTLPNGRASLLQSSAPRSDAQLARVANELLRNTQLVRFVEANTLFQLAQGANGDPDFPEQWSLQTIQIEKAWVCTRGSPKVVVAIVDSGIGPNPDIDANLWNNPCEVPDGQDNACPGDSAGNGIVDDLHGWNTLSNGPAEDGDITDDGGHGTSVAAVVGAVADNGIGIAGVSPRVSLAAIRVGAFPPAWAVVKGLYYAIGIGARVINVSLTGVDSQNLRDAVQDVGAAGIPLVAAAGESQFQQGADLKYGGVYPAAYPVPQVVAVLSTTKADQLEPFSNYGATVVEIGAPGADIVLGDIDSKSGSSMAAPHVTGVAALLLAVRPQASVAQLRDWLSHGDPVSAVAGKTEWGVRLNARKALEAAVGPCSQQLGVPAAPVVLP